MKIYVVHPGQLNFKDELYTPLRQSPLSDKHEIILPHEVHDDPTDFVTRDIIPTCDVVIAEVSFPSTGSGIELGWANKAEVPIVCLYRKNHKLSSALKVVTDRFYEYTDQEDVVSVIEQALSDLQ